MTARRHRRRQSAPHRRGMSGSRAAKESRRGHQRTRTMEVQETLSAAALERKLGPLDRETYTAQSCEHFADTIAEVKALKRERRAVILAHNYQRPEIFEVADIIGDSYELASRAREIKDAEVIVFCGVHFMAETAKVFNPDRKVLIPDMRAGCSLAESVTAEALADRR